MTRRFRAPKRYLVAVLVGAALVPLRAQEASPQVTPGLLQHRLAAAQDSTELDEATRARLIDLYRQSLSNLEGIQSSTRAAESFREAARNAPEETARIRAELEQQRLHGTEDDDSSSLAAQRLAGTLDEALTGLTVAETELAALQTRLDEAERRPSQARRRIGVVRSLLSEIAPRSAGPVERGENPQVAEALRWAFETQAAALRAEILMLDQEVLSHAARTDLLTAQRDLASERRTQIAARVDHLRALLGEQRHAEARLAIEEARQALSELSSTAPAVRDLAESNLSLAELLEGQVVAFDALSSQERGRVQASQIEEAYRSARRKLDLSGSWAPVGGAILAERRRFPGAREFSGTRRRVSRSIAEVSLRLAESEEERRGLEDLAGYVERHFAGLDTNASASGSQEELQSLARMRRTLLDRTIANDIALQQRLYERQDALDRVIEMLTKYDTFLAKRLLWVRSDPGIGAGALSRMPRELRAYFAPGRWIEVLRVATVRLFQAPVFGVCLTLALVLAGSRRKFRSALRGRARDPHGTGQDGVGSTLGAMGFTLLLAAPVPLSLAAVGGALLTANVASVFPNAVGAALLRLSFWVALPILIRSLALPGGVTQHYLGWDEAVLKALRRQLTWFIALVLPALFILRTSLAMEPPYLVVGLLSFLCFLGIMLGTAALILALERTTRESLDRLLASRSPGARWRWRFLWLTALLTILLGGVFLALLGYSYAAEEMMRRFFLSIWVVTVIWLVAALVRRWLFLTAQKLATGPLPGASAEQRRSPAGPRADQKEQAAEVQVLGADSRRLLNGAVLLAVVLGLFAVWGDMLPALGILENVPLWDQIEMVEGNQETVAVTLWDLLVATATALGGFILARNLPSLIEIILMKQGSVSAGGRYTAGTLTRYAITATTLLAVLHRLGASASQMGWAAAALGVGIGFGLQEIVANFICGLILLFERPVRVGDVITIGDASGTVTKIRIRATTVRDWEQKELVIPNKELITGRLLNWTLSDAVIRVLITVGVAYGSDVERAMALIRETARETPMVLDEPPPAVYFEQFGESSLILTLRAYVGDVAHRLPATTELHKGIDRRFRDAGIVIAFPQRDVHLHAAEHPGAPPVATLGSTGSGPA